MENEDVQDKAASVFPAAVKKRLVHIYVKICRETEIEVIVSDGKLLRSVKNVTTVRK